MKNRSLLWITAAVCALSLDSLAQPAPGSSAGARPGTSASASANAKVEIPPWPAARDGFPAFDAEPFPAEKTKTPDDADWKNAVQVRLSRVSPAVPSGCRAWRIREWMKIHCDVRTGGVRLLAGNTDGVALFVPPPLPVDIAAIAKQVGREESIVREEVAGGKLDWAVNQQRLESIGRFGQIVFPMRKGDRRVFEWLTLDVWEGYDGPPSVGATSKMIVEELWLEGEAPRVALLTR